MNEDKYNQEIAKQYKKRNLKLSAGEVLEIIKPLGFDIEENDIVEAPTGNMNATFLTSDIVIKIRNDKTEQKFLANKIVSEKFYPKLPVVNVLSYDYFEKTSYEALIMQLAIGELLLEGFLKMSIEEQKSIFGQMLQIQKEMFALTFPSFGEIKQRETFETFAQYIKNQFNNYVKIIKEKSLCEDVEIEKIVDYFLSRLKVFENDREAILVHTDLHIGNVIYQNDKITCLIDFDSAVKGPRWFSLVTILASINNPSQFVEGTKYFKDFENKKFPFLYEALKAKMGDVLADKNLVQKLNLAGIVEGLKWVSEDWSVEWNKMQIKNLLKNELAETSEALEKSYYGKIFKEIMNTSTG